MLKNICIGTILLLALVCTLSSAEYSGIFALNDANDVDFISGRFPNWINPYYNDDMLARNISRHLKERIANGDFRLTGPAECKPCWDYCCDDGYGDDFCDYCKYYYWYDCKPSKPLTCICNVKVPQCPTCPTCPDCTCGDCSLECPDCPAVVSAARLTDETCTDYCTSEVDKCTGRSSPITYNVIYNSTIEDILPPNSIFNIPKSALANAGHFLRLSLDLQFVLNQEIYVEQNIGITFYLANEANYNTHYYTGHTSIKVGGVSALLNGCQGFNSQALPSDTPLSLLINLDDIDTVPEGATITIKGCVNLYVCEDDEPVP